MLTAMLLQKRNIGPYIHIISISDDPQRRVNTAIHKTDYHAD